MAKINHSCKQP